MRLLLLTAAIVTTVSVTGCEAFAQDKTGDSEKFVSWTSPGASVARKSISEETIGIAALPSVVLSPAVLSPAAQGQSPLLHHQAPEFKMQVYGKSTKSLSLNEILRKKQPVILNVFASWCPPCNTEAPDLQKLQKQYEGKIQVIGADMIAYDSLSGLQTFLKKHQVSYPVLLDKASVMERSYQVAAYPTTFGINRNGKIVAFHLGYMNSDDMQKMANALLTSNH